MKRYIRASITKSCPEWLRRKLESGLGKDLVSKFSIPLDRVEFIDYKPEGSNYIPVYLLQLDNYTQVYIPGVNGDETGVINGRYRTLKSIGKSKLDEMAIDTVYIDLNDPNNTFAKKERYQDPRYSYYRGGRGYYAGQFRRRNYVGNGQYEEGEWSSAGRTPSNETRARDKSGYEIVPPEKRIAQYYQKFPEKVTQKIDSVYDQLLDVKAELMEFNFNSPYKNYNDRQYGTAFRFFGEAVNEYQELLGMVADTGKLKGNDPWQDDDYMVSRFSRQLSEIKHYLGKVKEELQ